MLCSKNLTKKLWAEAVNTAAYVLNRSRKTSIENQTLFELWHGRKSNIKYFRIFGSEAYVFISKSCRKQWDAKSKLGIFVGYDDCTKGFRILTSNNKIEIHRDILFKDERKPSDLPENKDDYNFSFYEVLSENNEPKQTDIGQHANIPVNNIIRNNVENDNNFENVNNFEIENNVENANNFEIENTFENGNNLRNYNNLKMKIILTIVRAC